MSNSQDNDSQSRFALGFLTLLLVLVVGTVVGSVVVQRLRPDTAAAQAAAEAVRDVAAQTEIDVATVQVDNGVVTFFFASNSANLAEGAQQALADVVQAIAAGRKTAISGYHDETGSVEQNAALALQRAEAVRDLLKALGAQETLIELRKPELTTGTGTPAQARRVEVILLPN